MSNKTQLFSIFLFISLIISLTSCFKKDHINPSFHEEENNFEATLSAYFKSFEQEGAKRGWSINLEQSEIIGEIAEIHQENVAGQCRWSSHQPNLVTIDKSFWNNSSDLSKEMVVFHELGHCFLNRGHREDQHTNGQCISIMRSGLEGCLDNYTAATRKTYLDELFDAALAQN